MFRFFKKKIRAGMPISTDGFMNGIQWMAEALERMKVNCGHIEWSQGHIPTIVIDPIMLTGTQGDNHPFKLATFPSNVNAMFMPSDSFAVNGKDFTSSQTGLTAIAGSVGWYDVTAFASTGLNAYIVFGALTSEEEQGKPVSLKFATTEPTVLSNQRAVKIPILAYSADTGLYTLHHSAINYERIAMDGDSPYPSWKSLSRPSTNAGWANEDHSVGLNAFVTASAPEEDPFAETPARTQHIGMRETVSTGGAHLRWYNLRTLISSIQTLANESSVEYVIENIQDIYDDTWKTWYDSLTDGYFWEQGADNTINYGSAIGNSAKEIVIDLDSQTLFTGTSLFDWTMAANLVPTLDNALNLGSDSFKWLGVYAHTYFDGAGNEGITLSNWFGGGIAIGANIIEINAEDLQPNDKILVRR